MFSGHSRGGAAELQGAGPISLRDRIARFVQKVKTEMVQLRYDAIASKKAAGRTGWWSDVPDSWNEEEFKARRDLARSKGWWWELQDRIAAAEHRSRS